VSTPNGLTDTEWSDVLATLPENPETADGWELDLVRRTVDRILAARLEPIRALADEWEADSYSPGTNWREADRMLGRAIRLRAALDNHELDAATRHAEQGLAQMRADLLGNHEGKADQ
jgi:hypothetical protein